MILFVDTFVGNPSLGIKAEALAVARAVSKSGRRSQLALSLLDVFFDQQTLAESTVRGSRDGSKKALDPSIVEAIQSNSYRELL